MKKLLVLILLAAPLVASAQKRVSADDVRGEWKVVFQLDKEVDEAENAFERIALKAVSGLMDEIDIRLLFERDGVLTVSASAFGEGADTDSDDISWDINRHGGLIVGDSDHFQSDRDTVFYWEGDQLVAFEINDDGKAGDRKGISLKRVDA